MIAGWLASGTRRPCGELKTGSETLSVLSCMKPATSVGESALFVKLTEEAFVSGPELKVMAFCGGPAR